MPQSAACPDLSRFRQLAADRLPEAEKEALLGHLEGCDSCARQVDKMPEPDTLVDLLRRAQTIPQAGCQEAIDTLIQRLSQLRPEKARSDEEPTLPPSVSVALLSFACPRCGKQGKVKGELAGKKVRCPRCRQVVVVPQGGARGGGGGVRKEGSTATVDAQTPVPQTNGAAVGFKTAAAADKSLYDFLAPPQASDELGRLGIYRVLEVLGAGGMGVVFRAEDPHLKRLVALKAMLPTLAPSESARQRFLREARAVAAIKHDHIVSIYQVDQDRGVPFLAMEFLEGEPLDARLQREAKLPVPEVLRIGRDIASGLAAAHKRGLIHRDIKPANIWLEEREGHSAERAAPSTEHSALGAPRSTRVKILDFGLARGTEEETRLTQHGAIIGTPAYMAPEQGQGKAVDQRCDLFSLGCVLYRMATGELPFKGTDTISTLLAVATESPKPPHELDPALPPALSELILNLLAKVPAERPSSAQVVVESLDRLAREQEVWPTPEELRAKARQKVDVDKPETRGQRSGWNRRAWGGAMAVAVAAFVIGGIVIFWETPHGMVRMESDDPTVQIVIDKDGPTLKFADKKPITLRAGEHGILVKRGDFTFETKSFLVKKGQTVTLNVKLLPGKIQLFADGEKIVVRDIPLALTFTNSLGMEFVLVPKGKSWLGGGGGTPGTQAIEMLHDFYLGKHEVTQEEWQKVMGENPSTFKAVPGIDNEDQKRFPVEQVSWEDAQAFIEHLNKRAKETGWVYRLPTESEWEYACRGGPMKDRSESAFDFYFDRPANQLLPIEANFEHDKGLKRPSKVGMFKPNRLGLHDMHGNVSELCADKRSVGLRGGAWNSAAAFCKAPNRTDVQPGHRSLDFGLRVARVPVGKEIVKAAPEKPAFKNSLGMEFVLVPKGAFYMGGGGGKPGRKTEIKEDFEMGVHHVTQGQWRAVMGAPLNPVCWFSRTGPYSERVADVSDEDLKQFPVDNVSWHDAQAFVKRLNEKELGKGYLYRLPTEAEWEYACRGGASSPEECSYHFYTGKPSNDLSSREANFDGDQPAGDAPKGPNLKRTTKVGSYPPNKLGLYDMHGNLTQWCQDAFAEGSPGRVMRGGNFLLKGMDCRSGWRGLGVPDHKQHYCGFRVVRVRLAPGRDRRAAEWVLSLGGAVSVHVGGADREVRAGGKLPMEAFELLRVDLSSNLPGGNPVVNRALNEGDGLSHLAGLTNLVRIDLHNTTVTDAGLAHLNGLTNLRELVLFYCPEVNDACVAHLKDLTNLRWLDLNGTRVTDAGLVHLKGLQNLTFLALHSTRISGTGFVNLKGLTKLETFFLPGSQVDDKGLAHLEGLSNLRTLGLEGTRVTDAGLVHLKGLTKLTWIALSGPSVSDAGLVHLQQLPNLTGLDLRGAQVSDVWLKQLHGLSKLRNLYLHDTKVTAEGIAALKKALPECRVHRDVPGGAFKNSLGMEFVLVPKGKSWLGGGGKPGNKEVETANDFYLGKYEVTQEEWERVMASNPSHFKSVAGISQEDQKRFPVESVSWEDCQTFIKRLNEKSKEAGWAYRLPTELEWEYACRGGPMKDKFESAFDFYLAKSSNSLLPDQANFAMGLRRTCKVGRYQPNRLGLYDMHGNVWEWCDDEVAAHAKDPKAASRRACRGGGWGGPDTAEHCRAAVRHSWPTSGDHHLGLRLARVPIGKEIVKLAPARPEPTTKLDRDRRAAEWVLSLGGAVSVHVNGVDRDVRAGGKLPTEAFELRRIDLSSHLYGGNPVVNRAVKDDDGLSHLAGLTNLVRIDLHNTTGANAGLAHLKALTSLRELYLFGCLDVSDGGVAHLKDLTNLRNLDLNATRVTDAGLVHLKGLTKLTYLNLMNTRSSGAGFVYFKGLTKLEVSYSQVDDQGLAHLKGMSNLADLNLQGTRVTDAGLVHLKGLTKLMNIDLSGPSVSDTGLVHLQRLPNLTQIGLHGAQVSDAWLKQLHGFTKLRNLILRDTKVTAEGITAFKKARPECRVDAPSKELTNSPGMKFNTFAALVPERARGKWRVTDDLLEQTTLSDRVWITFGETSWTDYDFNLEFKRVQGIGCLLAAFRLDWENVLAVQGARAVHPGRACVFGLGQWSNIAYTLESWSQNGKPWQLHAKKENASVPADTWMRARVRVRRDYAECFLNDDKLFGGTMPSPKGCVGLMTFGAAYRFRNIMVTDPKGKVLLQGLPDLDESRFTNSLGMEFVRVPKGKSWLGGHAGKPGNREVEFKEDFYLGKFELTQGEWETITGKNPSEYSRTGTAKDFVKGVSDGELKKFPVERVSWYEIQLFLEKLNNQAKESGWVYRLPTEAEWEYACRGGPMTDKLDSAFDWYLPKPTNELPSDSKELNFWGHLKRTCKVGSYKPNRLGLYDIHGNVWEWCNDVDSSKPEAPMGVARGGGLWDHSGSGYCRANCRSIQLLSAQNAGIGFRLARVPAGAIMPLLQPGSVWVGKRSYRRGWYAGFTVTYELHVRERTGSKFKGHIFDNGPGRNRAEVEGEIKGENIVHWREQGRLPERHINVRATFVGARMQVTLTGKHVNGSTYLEGDGELTLR
jgi:formylglycine-generating enzyme required for sulfatase activity/serine/threonine protein kinase/Leucine-rich repeat (LRR) protein